MREATGDPNYFPNDEDEENSKEESDDASLVGNELIIGGAGLDEENVFDHDQDENNVLEDVFNQDIGRFKCNEPVQENHNKNRQKDDRSYKTPV